MNRKQHKRQLRRAEPREFQLWHPDVPGPLWTGMKRVQPKQIQAYCRVLAREFQPERIILFGSYATGSATPQSDVDLIIVMPFRGNPTDHVVEIRGRVEAPFPMDLLLWQPSRMRSVDSFTRTVLKEGKIMYETRHA